MLQRADHSPGNQPGRQHAYKQRQRRGQADGQGITLQLALQGLLLPKIGLVDTPGNPLGAGLQLRL
ncbi:hypothetical protein D9M73_295450 [compost metagenome]